jgi:hypothetical protein
MRHNKYINLVPLTLVACLAMTGCETTSPSLPQRPAEPQRPPAPQRPPEPKVNLPAPYTSRNVTVTVEGLWKNGLGEVSGISGTAKNVGNVDLKLCEVKFDILDSTGVKVSDALASTYGLNAGQTWRFQATFTTPYAVSFSTVQASKVLALRER